jgi:pyridoxamine 5'-phosphate oxidase
MKLQSVQKVDFLEIISWISSSEACRQWAGPSVKYPLSIDSIEENLSVTQHRSFVLVDENSLILGFGQLLEKSNGRIHLGRIIVNPKVRGNGYGRKLCKMLMKEAKECFGAKISSLNVYLDNVAAISLYRSLGFKNSEPPQDSKLEGDVMYMELSQDKDPVNDFIEEYQEGLRREQLDLDPFKQFELWFQQACTANLPNPNAMSLATVSTTAEPSQRMVLLKYFDRQGFVFFTNYESKKACQIKENPQVSLLFFWTALQRQVQIAGNAVKISTAESLKYFATRPRGSQIGAWCSQQSTVISSRQMLNIKFDEIKRKFQNLEIPLPSAWGGYRIVPHSFEFWQGRPNRLHDRFLYSRLDTESSWDIQRLAP